jgi:putative FmdB family regulatory protein
MPIYAYKCSDCGFEQDVMQKMSDTPLTECPSCGKATFAKQLTAAGFALKGSGWYATDFKGGATAKKEESAAPACATGSCCACTGGN